MTTMETSESTRTWPRSLLPFFVFAVVGGFAVFSAHWLQVGRWWFSFWGPAAIALLLMVLYGWWDFSVFRSRGEIDRLGDNFYYLGLTYTVWGLGSALFGFGGAEDVDRLVSATGLALSSTVFGIVGRILLYEQAASQRRAADPAEAARTLQDHLAALGQSLEDFRDRAAAALRGLADALAAQVTGATTEVQKAAGSLGENAAALAATVRETRSSLQRSARAILSAGDLLQDRLGSLRGHLDDLDHAIAGLVVPASELTRTLQSIQAASAQLSSSLAVLGDAASALPAPLGRTEAALEAFPTVVDRARDSLESFVAGTRSAAGALSTLGNDAAQWSSAGGTLSTAADALLAVAGDLRGWTDKAASSRGIDDGVALRTLEQLATTNETLANNLLPTATGLAAAIDGALPSLKGLADHLARVSSVLGSRQDDRRPIEAAVDRLVAALERLEAKIDNLPQRASRGARRPGWLRWWQRRSKERNPEDGP
jgi:ABC-type transporter Mla subunit MlaD